MCVILHRQADTIVDEKDIIEAYEYNPDGCGLMYKANGKIVAQKGLWTLDYLLDKLHSLENIEYALHLRIMTVGNINQQNCHPFKVGKNIYMMHNGTFKISQTNKDMSDTWHVAKFLQGFKLTEKFFDKFAEYIEYNRVLFMGPKGIKKLGKWEILDDNYWSNLNWVGGAYSFDYKDFDSYDDYYMRYHDYKDAFDEYVSDY
jgi:predicted glutamine amidotransferase